MWGSYGVSKQLLQQKDSFCFLHTQITEAPFQYFALVHLFSLM